MEVNPKPRHVLEAKKDELQICDRDVRWLKEDEGVISVLQVGNSARDEVGSQASNVPCAHGLIQDSRQDLHHEVKQERREGGSPCRTPRPFLKYGPSSPLMEMAVWLQRPD